MDGWDDRYLAQCRFCFTKVFSGKEKKGAGWGTRRVLPWHSCGSEYSLGTTEKRRWSCLIDRCYSWKVNEFPLP
jgi:hypothetical protein